jgi:hypothetical protein
MPCATPAVLPPIFLRANSADQGAGTALASTNSTCAVVRISPALAPGQAATLVLPAGARYNALAGSLQEQQRVPVSPAPRLP